MLAQTRGSSFAIEVAGERHAPLRESEDDPRDQAPDHHAHLEACRATSTSRREPNMPET
jgi:hypothetical protein